MCEFQEAVESGLIDGQLFLQKKRELIRFIVSSMSIDELPDLITFTFEGFRVDITEEVYRLFI